jgi:hypothetical protein
MPKERKKERNPNNIYFLLCCKKLTQMEHLQRAVT